MTIVTIHEAKTHLSKLIAKAIAGEEIVVARGKEPMVRLVPVKPVAARRRIPGRYAHLRPPGSKGILDSGFWAPLSDEDVGLGDDPLLDPRP